MTADETFYIKRGRRYKPVSYYDSVMADAMPEGFHLIHVKPGGGRSTLYNVEPDRAAVLAAVREHYDELCKLVSEVSKAHIDRLPKHITLKQRAALDEVERVFKWEMTVINRQSAASIVEALAAALAEKVK